jgi:hypothetical protein
MRELLNPFVRCQSVDLVHRAGTIADWLHNLALYSAIDFARFDEDRFWHKLDRLEGEFPKLGFEMYRRTFMLSSSAA